MNSLDSLFDIEKRCKEHDCNINNKNVKVIYKPDNGFLDKSIEKEIFGSDYKICDCIIVCNNDNIVIVEILCGTLTYKEYKEKCEQLENCHKVVAHKGLDDKVKKIILHYKRLENPKHNPQFRKKLINPKICGVNLELLKEATINIDC